MALRTFTAPDGVLWHVYNVEPASTPRLVTPGLENGWLVFESGTHKYRIVHHGLHGQLFLRDHVAAGGKRPVVLAGRSRARTQ